MVLLTWPLRDELVQRRSIGARKSLSAASSDEARLQGPENAKEMRCLKGVNINDIKSLIAGGEGGIRTHGTVTRTTVFETAPSQMRIGEGKRGGCSP